jgi:long-subunit acyl-CoA synthetase (AMP-forming)
MSLLEDAKAAGLTLHNWVDMDALDKENWGGATLTHEPTKEDTYILSYTSGTTGDSKGVKLSHNNILSVIETTKTRTPINNEGRMISYLPLPHSFE